MLDLPGLPKRLTIDRLAHCGPTRVVDPWLGLFVQGGHFTLVVPAQQLDGFGAVASPGHLWVGCNAHDASARE